MVQDTIMGWVSLIFVISLSMQLIKVVRTKDTSSFSYILTFGNAIGLFILFGCMWSLNLYFSSSILLVQGILWLTVGLLKLKWDKKD
jgi:uncharacterized protein with PQ loop repeat